MRWLAAATFVACLAWTLPGHAQISRFVQISSIPPLSEQERADIARYLAAQVHSVNSHEYLAVSSYDEAKSGLMFSEDAQALSDVRAKAAEFRVQLENKAKQEAEEKARADKEAQAFAKWAATPAGRRELAAQRVSEAQRCVSSWQAIIDHENEIGRASGFVNKHTLYSAGQMVVHCKTELAQALKACKAEKGCS